MRFSWLFKQNAYAGLLLLSIVVVLFLILAVSNKFNPYLSLGLTLFFILLAKIILAYSKRLDKGADGEALVREQLHKLPQGYYHLNDFNYGVYVVGLNWVNRIILEQPTITKLTPEQCSFIKDLLKKQSSII